MALSHDMEFYTCLACWRVEEAWKSRSVPVDSQLFPPADQVTDVAELLTEAGQ
jgi:hypothetical protein